MERLKAVIPQQQTTAQRILAAMEKLGPDADPLDIARLALDEAQKEAQRQSENKEPPLQIEAWKFYRARDGRQVFVHTKDAGGVFWGLDADARASRAWDAEGRAVYEHDSPGLDIVDEWPTDDRYKRAVNALIEVCEEIHDLPYHLRQEIDEVLKEAEGVAYTVMR